MKRVSRMLLNASSGVCLLAAIACGVSVAWPFGVSVTNDLFRQPPTVQKTPTVRSERRIILIGGVLFHQSTDEGYPITYSQPLIESPRHWNIVHTPSPYG